MSGSFKRIDYSLRPAKHAERRMLCDVFRRLRPFGRIEDYVYVGFGSIWFSDFTLMHRALGVKAMISIEQAEEARERIEDNKPFRIPVDYRKSEDALPALDWAKKQFVWLDYDDPLAPGMLLDMRTAAQRASSGTVLSVSVQCTKAEEARFNTAGATGAPTDIDNFTAVFGRERIALGTRSDQLFGWPFGVLSRSMLQQEIMAELAVRNAASNGSKIDFKTICEIEYEDGAKMTTLVGIFYSADDLALVEQCHFDALDFLPAAGGTVRIKVPKLTTREFRKLESQLPLSEGLELELGTIPVSEARSFAELYRYFPNFAVLET
jgi:hypothetical protein